MHTHTHTRTQSLTLSLSCCFEPHNRALAACCHAKSFFYSLLIWTCVHSLSLSLSHTHTYTHKASPSLGVPQRKSTLSFCLMRSTGNMAVARTPIRRCIIGVHRVWQSRLGCAWLLCIYYTQAPQANYLSYILTLDKSYEIKKTRRHYNRNE